MLDILIKNARIIDGTGSPWFHGEIGISGQNIVSVKRYLNTEAKRTIDASNLIVCPGFIDTHTHSDLLVLKYPEEMPKLMQGITTALLGQDGISVAPVNEKNVSLMKNRVAGLLGTYVENWSWNSIEEYLDEIERARPTTNNVMLVPHGNVRSMVIGWDNRKATEKEISQMKEIICNSFDEGAFGVSIGLIYPPAMYADKNELIEILQTTADNGGIFVVHLRNESNQILESLDEMISLGRITGCPIHVSHFKVAGQKNWGKSKDVLGMIDRARNEHIDVTYDQYPYIAASTLLDVIIPPWFHEGGTESMLARLKDPAKREELKKAHEEVSDIWENMVEISTWDGIYITSVKTEKNKSVEGKNISQLAKEMNKSPSDVVADILIEEELAATAVLFYGDEGDVENIMKHPCMCVCSDGIVGGKPHPRVYGTFPRILGRYVREQGVLTLEAAIQKMTANPARLLNLQNRGIIREGMRADITVFDPGAIIDNGTFAEPNIYPDGIVHVLVNGVLALEEGKITGNRSGETIRYKKN